MRDIDLANAINAAPPGSALSELAKRVRNMLSAETRYHDARDAGVEYSAAYRAMITARYAVTVAVWTIPTQPVVVAPKTQGRLRRLWNWLLHGWSPS